MTNYPHLTCVVGPMFSAKSTFLIQRVQRSCYAKQRIKVFTPSIDNRRGIGRIVSHSNINLVQATGITPEVMPNDASQDEFMRLASELNFEGCDLVAIDEIQFFSPHVIDFIETLTTVKNVLVTGLDMTAEGKPFGCVPQLLAMAQEVIKLTSICELCHEPATRTFYKKGGKTQEVVVGGEEDYAPRCVKCWRIGMNI
jgi:thymidine kinase